MNDIPVSLFLGPVFLALTFLFCLILVAGAKILYYYFKQPTKKLTRKKVKPVKSAKPDSEKAPRSIEINADEVDKIYVKRAS